MTDQTNFETIFAQRLQAYAGSAVRPVSTTEVARSTIAAAATPVGRTGPRHPALLIGLAAALLLAAVAGAGWIGGQPPAIQGVFVAGPSLAQGHDIVAAVPLLDGRVLVGVVSPESDTGSGALQCTAPCRPHLSLLDPGTGAFTLPADLPPFLPVQSMALLHDGRVLLVRTDERIEDRRAAIYDPVADRYETVGAPVEGRFWPFVVTLADGRVLVGGGEPLENAAPSGVGGVAEVFDPAMGTFTSTGPMSRPRGTGATATLLQDGRVLVVGGGVDVGTSAEVFDPATGTFSPTGSMTRPRGAFQSSTLLPDGRVLIAGGLVPDAVDPTTPPDATADAEVYDPATGTFSSAGSMAEPRFMHGASILADGTVLVVGGAHDLPAEGEPLPAPVVDAEIFDPTTGTFRATGDLGQGRLMPLTTVVGDRVLVLGNLDPTATDPDGGASTEWFQ